MDQLAEFFQNFFQASAGNRIVLMYLIKGTGVFIYFDFNLKVTGVDHVKPGGEIIPDHSEEFLK